MGITDFISVLRTATALSFVIGLFWGILATVNFYRSRNDSLWRYRRQAGQRGFRFSVLTAFFLALSVALCLITATVTYVETQPSTVAENPTLTVTLPSATPSLIPTEIPSPVPSLPIPPTEAIVIMPEILPSNTPVVAVRLEIVAIDDVITDDWRPIQPETTFTGANLQRLYFFFSYENISRDQTWGQELLREGLVIQSYSQKWGETSPQGESFFFFGDQAGFSAGNYEVRLTLDETPIAVAQFIILPE